MDNLVKELRNIVARKDVGDDYLLMNSKYVPLKISQENFHEIRSITSNSDSKIMFVDGGNSVLFESAEFCIGIIRVGSIIYTNNKRLSRNKEEFYIFIREDNGKFIVKTYPDKSFNNTIFNPDDELLKNGIEKCGVSKIVSIIRRFAELEYAYTHSKNVDFILLDGTMEARYPLEDKYLDKLLLTKKVCALSKTCTLVTKNGLSITKKLLDLGKTSSLNSWTYHPIVINNNPKHLAELYFVKLNNKSAYVFRFEIQKEFKGEIQEIFSTLYQNSNDPIFLGYPYGLIDIDQYARVSDEETKMLQTKFSTKLGKEWNEFSKHLNSTNAHSILDHIRF